MEIRLAGYLIQDALQAGFTPFECRGAGFQIDESLEAAGLTPRPPDGERPPWFTPRMSHDDSRFTPRSPDGFREPPRSPGGFRESRFS